MRAQSTTATTNLDRLGREGAHDANVAPKWRENCSTMLPIYGPFGACSGVAASSVAQQSWSAQE